MMCFNFIKRALSDMLFTLSTLDSKVFESRVGERGQQRLRRTKWKAETGKSRLPSAPTGFSRLPFAAHID
jgi:hypothetical protein